MHSRCLALCSWSLQPENPVELVKNANACQIQSLQLALVPLVEDLAWANALHELEKGGVQIVSGMLETVGEDYSTLKSIAQTGGVRPDSSWPATLERATKVAVLAGEMQLDVVTFHAGFLPEHSCEERSKMLSRIETLGDLFGNHSIQLALETGQEDAPTLVGVFEELSHPMVGVNFDPANMILYGKGDPVDAIQMLRPWVKQVHIKDAVHAQTEGEWGTEVPVGQGEVDWIEFLQHVPEDVNLVIERESGTERVKDILLAKRLLEGWLA